VQFTGHALIVWFGVRIAYADRKTFMIQPQTVLVVAHDAGLASMLVSWLADSGCRLAVTGCYRAGKNHLESGPAMVITEIKLGAYNGLQLALRAQAKGIPVVVFGDENSTTAREAEEAGAAYIDSSNMRKEELQSLVRAIVTP
jgi:DNA-binding NtrC family response regulator